MGKRGWIKRKERKTTVITLQQKYDSVIRTWTSNTKYKVNKIHLIFLQGTGSFRAGAPGRRDEKKEAAFSSSSAAVALTYKQL